MTKEKSKINKKPALELMKLAFFVEKNEFVLPYLITKTFPVIAQENNVNYELILPLTKEMKEFQFIELLLRAAFIFQPRRVESVLFVIIKKAIGFKLNVAIEGGNPQNLGEMIMAEIFRIVNSSIEILLKEHQKKKTEALLWIINNYVQFVGCLGDLISQHWMELSETTRNNLMIDLSTFLEKICQAHLASSNPEVRAIIEFQALQKSVSSLYVKHNNFPSESDLTSWITDKFSFLISESQNMEEATLIKTSKNLLTLAEYIPNITFNKEINGDTKTTKVSDKLSALNTQDVNLTWCGDYYYSSRWEYRHLYKEEEVSELLDSLRGNGLSITTITLSSFPQTFDPFYQSIGLHCSVSPDSYLRNKGMNEINTSHIQIYDITKRMIAKKNEEEALAKPKEPITGVSPILNKEEEKKVSKEKKPQESKITSSTLMKKPAEQPDSIMVEETKANKNEAKKETTKGQKEEKKETISVVIDENEDQELVTRPNLLQEHCEAITRLQKQFIESLSLHEVTYSLSNPSLEEIKTAKKEFLDTYVQSLQPVSLGKLFVYFMPAFLKEQLPKTTLARYQFTRKANDSIVKNINQHNYKRFSQAEIFDFLNLSMSRYVADRSNLKSTATISTPLFKPSNQGDTLAMKLNLAAKERIFEGRFNADRDDALTVQKAAKLYSLFSLSDSALEKLLLSVICSLQPPPICFSMNPLNGIRLAASMLELLEDTSDEKLKLLFKNHEIPLVSNVDLILRACCINVSFSYELALKMPTYILKRFATSSLKDLSWSKEGPLNGIERIVEACLRQESDIPYLFQVVEFIITMLIKPGTQLIIEKDIQKYNHSIYKYQLISHQTAEKIWKMIMAAKAKNQVLNYDHLVRGLMENYEFISTVSPIIFQSCADQLIAVKKQLNSLSLEIKKIETEELLCELLEKTDLSLCETFCWLLDIFTTSIVGQFNNITNNRDFHEKNLQSDGKLAQWAFLIKDFINLMLDSDEKIKFIIAAFEVIHDTAKVIKFNVPLLSRLLWRSLLNIQAALILLEDIVILSEENTSEKPENMVDLENFQTLEQSLHIPTVLSREASELRELELTGRSFSQIKQKFTTLKPSEVYMYSLLSIPKPYLVQLLIELPETHIAKTCFAFKYPYLLDLSERERNSGIRNYPRQNKCMQLNFRLR